jgi:hypothetical protein
MPGDYLVVAIDDADVADNQDSAFFDALARGATRITVGDAEKKSQDLGPRQGEAMIWLLLSIVLGFQTSSRDVPNFSRTGTGIIAGTVLTDDAEARPIRRVVVTLTAGGIPLPRSAQTDETGRFTFVGIPSGNYTLQAARVGYVTAYYGSKKPGRGPGIPVSVADGQRAPDVTLKMLRGAVITGVIRMPGGKPAAELNVRASLVTMVNGQRQVDTLKSAVTDDRGEYRLYGLAPGEYIIQASAPPIGNDMRRMTAAEISSAEAVLRDPTSSAPVPAQGPSVNFATVLFPGYDSRGCRGNDRGGDRQERAGVDMTLDFVQTARLAGTVISPDGRAPQMVRLSLSLKGVNDIETYYANYYGVSARPDGSFFHGGHFTRTLCADRTRCAACRWPTGAAGRAAGHAGSGRAQSRARAVTLGVNRVRRGRTGHCGSHASAATGDDGVGQVCL